MYTGLIFTGSNGAGNSRVFMYILEFPIYIYDYKIPVKKLIGDLIKFIIHIMSLTYSHSPRLDRNIDDQNTINLLATLRSDSVTLIR